MLQEWLLRGYQIEKKQMSSLINVFIDKPLIGMSTSIGGLITGYIPNMFKWYLFWEYHVPPIVMESLQALVWLGTIFVIYTTLYGWYRRTFKKK